MKVGQENMSKLKEHGKRRKKSRGQEDRHKSGIIRDEKCSQQKGSGPAGLPKGVEEV
jgi:hypothetical protein